MRGSYPELLGAVPESPRVRPRVPAIVSPGGMQAMHSHNIHFMSMWTPGDFNDVSPRQGRKAPLSADLQGDAELRSP